MDNIILEEIRVKTKIGITKEERARPRDVLVNVEIFLDLQKAGRSDDLADTIDYRDVLKLVNLLLVEKEFVLIESVAETIAQEVLRDFPTNKVITHV